MKEAVLLSMLPIDLQDMIYQNAETSQSFEEVREKVKAVVNNRLARSEKHGTPMDIGEVGKADASQQQTRFQSAFCRHTEIQHFGTGSLCRGDPQHLSSGAGSLQQCGGSGIQQQL